MSCSILVLFVIGRPKVRVNKRAWLSSRWVRKEKSAICQGTTQTGEPSQRRGYWSNQSEKKGLWSARSAESGGELERMRRTRSGVAGLRGPREGRRGRERSQYKLSESSPSFPARESGLTLVIKVAPLVLMRVLDHPDHILRRAFLSQTKLEPLPEPLDRRLSLEARQTRLEHEVDRIDELVRVRSDGEERLDRQLLEDPVTL